ncbi:MAG: macrolide ABC transporter ATP-binding protein [Spirochaetes bacterium GWD1_61_31]|nr:MAG: macrolide ABC transporter ATP-binding protein [Spirochaetes bacterium GWB1_60_80]OHD30180.1 MAG: macrolide ABC transporter ATP-binding protein [Spirochaetes bacterium GWC1_61_12]OHD35879.1 MAG: macrolide ABC transporter ATP-binding protein [Spirochaetes bacterium GWD1_61_31]OHD42160.1 MAG: macrolide ABC transporter ATP-binding protein [Spirochaetes bacterium GWE1_60_18]OHD59436.1 MAG: macrolide ABC transporter ATP-binding protein [Spirochaetes bacterium GWF1_60_12]HAP44051.1 macrolide 
MIELKNIQKAYGDKDSAVHALAGVSLTIKRGDFVTIMGPSGSGKSTLLHILGLLDQATGGEYLLENHPVTGLSDRELSRIRNEHYGFVFQSFNLIPELTAIENVALPLRYAGETKKAALARALGLLASVGLDKRAWHYPSQLSGGEQQRVAVARAIANEPDVIMADEPTGNLPSGTGAEIMRLLTDLNAGGVSLVVVTHDDHIGAMGHTRVRLCDGLVEAVAS